MCGKARTALHVAFPPKRISLRRHPDFSDPKNRSKRAFKFGLRGRKPTRFTTSRRRQVRNDCLNVVSQSLITHFLSLRKPSSWLVSSRVHVNSTKIDRWPSVKTHIFAVFVARLSILTPRASSKLLNTSYLRFIVREACVRSNNTALNSIRPVSIDHFCDAGESQQSKT